MKYVTCYSGIWQVSDRQYLKLLQTIADGKEYDLDNFGKHVGNIDLNVIDISSDQAKNLAGLLLQDSKRNSK